MVIKTGSTAELIDLGVNAEFTHSHCTQKGVSQTKITTVRPNKETKAGKTRMQSQMQNTNVNVSNK